MDLSVSVPMYKAWGANKIRVDRIMIQDVLNRLEKSAKLRFLSPTEIGNITNIRWMIPNVIIVRVKTIWGSE